MSDLKETKSEIKKKKKKKTRANYIKHKVSNWDKSTEE